MKFGIPLRGSFDNEKIQELRMILKQYTPIFYESFPFLFIFYVVVFTIVKEGKEVECQLIVSDRDIAKKAVRMIEEAMGYTD